MPGQNPTRLSIKFFIPKNTLLAGYYIEKIEYPVTKRKGSHKTAREEYNWNSST
jgi:hypothetical protein